MSRARLAVFSLALMGLVLLTAGGSITGAPSGPVLAPHVPGEILIKFRPGARGLERASALAQLNAVHLHTFREGGEHWRLGPGRTVEQALETMSRNPNVEHVTPNWIVTLDLVPNDPNLPQLYGMINTGQTGGTADADIDADQAWSVTTGSRSVVVGVIDTGVNHLHPDLAANIWTNLGEIPGNNLDDDNNGFIDDVHGYDFVNNDGDPMDDHGHGSHCAGTIGAVGNNGIGVVGVNWEVSIMGLKFLSASGSGSTANAVRAVNYATMMGADLTSNSWGGGAASPDLQAAIAAAGAAEIPFVAAAGNNSSNNDVTPHYPSNYDLANVIAVAATDHNDTVASFSNWGAVSVDLAAPGVNILSTVLGTNYQLFSGTSMATPHVAGAAALLKSRFPNIPAAQLKFALMNFTDKKPQLHPTIAPPAPAVWRPVASGGRLNVFFSIADPDDVAPGGVEDLSAPGPGSNHMLLQWTATGDDGDVGTATSYQVRYSTSPIDETNFDSAVRATGAPNPGPSGSSQTMEVKGLSASTLYHFAVRALDEWGNAGPLSNVVQATTLPPPAASIDPNDIQDHLFTGGTATHVATLSNVGAGTLDFTIPTPSVSTPLMVYPALPLEKDEPDPRPGILGSGGPDAAGYRWADSDDPGGPDFSWVEISGVGTPIASLDGDDEIANDIPIGFLFDFYDQAYTTVNVSTNGWLSFTNRTASGTITYTNQPLPNTSAPENLLAAFWDDLNFRGAVHAYYHNDGGRFIVQWNDVDRHPATEEPTPDHLTFQIILYPDGRIVYQYLTTNGKLDSMTAGIQNGPKNDGLTVVFNGAYLHDSLAVAFERIPQWLTAGPMSGRIAAGGSLPINVHLDAAGLDGGTYPGTVRILTNDPNQPELSVNVTLDVTGAPDAVVSPSAIDFGDVFLGVPFQRGLNVLNSGTDRLQVTNVTTNSPELEASPASFQLDPLFSQTVTIALTGSALGPFSGSVTVHSNDASEPAIVVPVTGNVIPSPVVVASPTSFDDTLFSGETATHTLTVSNTGGSDLIVTAAADQGNGGTGVTTTDPSAEGQGGPDGFGYRWRDSDALGGPPFTFVDIGTTGTLVTFSSTDNALSPIIDMGMTFPFYGTEFSSMKISTNGWLTFDTTTTATASANGALPSTALGRSAIAMFWDNLHLRTGQVRYLNDGLRFIVQFTNVGLATPTTGQSFTFQAQLYPNGRILLLYKTMVGVLNSATIGIQNQARTVALQVVSQTGSGTPYVHDDLALEIKRTPDWLSVTPAGATIPPGGSAGFDVVFDATDRPGGTLTGNVVLTTNIPNQATIPLPATLLVVGAPSVLTAPTEFDFGIVYIGYPQVTSFQVFNAGTDVLEVSDIDTTDPSLVVEEPPGPTAGFSLAPGLARVMNLRWDPTTIGQLSASVRVHSNDPVSPISSIAVTGLGLQPPVAVASPSSFSESLTVGGSVTRSLRVENQGNSDLNVTTAVRPISGASVTVHQELELEKEEEDPRAGILGLGGPDSYGYTWRDSDDPAGPAFDWFDISAIGTPVAGLDGDDENVGPIPIGFPFGFYGNTFHSVRVGTNGFITLTSTLTAVTNQALPNSGTSVPENLLAAFWDDLEFRSTERARYYNDGSRFIVQFTDVDRVGTAGNSHLTFQIILHPNGRIVYQYHTITTSTSTARNSHTIGIQNGLKNDGLTVAFNNGSYVRDGLAVEFAPPFVFPSIAPSGAVIPPGGHQDFDVRFDASGLNGGDYAASLDILSNDPARGLIPIPLGLHVDGTPAITASAESLAFPDTFVGGTHALPLTLRNVGNDVLNISSLSVAGDFSYAGASPPVSVGVNEILPLTVSFNPASPGAHGGSLTIASDDPDGDLVIALSGQGLLPPVAAWSPSSFTETLNAGDIALRTLRLENHGASDLTFDVSLRTATGASVTVHDEVPLAKGEEDPGPGILGDGGPDMFGYTWRDSDAPGGPPFDWTDISELGTPIAGLDGDDENLGPIPISFPFPFYGNAFTEVRVGTNGFLTFGSTLTAVTNQALPNSGTSVPPNLIAVFWDDLEFRSVEKARYYDDGTRFIVQYTDVDRVGTAGNSHLTFQVILHPDGRIVNQYLTMSSPTLTSATIGIQNATKTDGLTVLHNTAYMHNSLAVEILPPVTFLTVTPEEGVVPPGGGTDLAVGIDTVDLVGGDYTGIVELITNDPLRTVVQVPLSLHVDDAADIDVQPAALLFPDTFAGFGSTLPITVHNRGSIVLNVTGAAATGPFAVDVSPLPAGLPDDGTLTLAVTFLPPGGGPFTGSVTIDSDDPDEPSVTIPLSGLGVIPPEIDVAPPALSTALPPGGSRAKLLTVHNNGGSDLIWTAGASNVSALGAQVTVYDELELGRGEEDPRPGILGSGGPDMFGYSWKDSDEPGGPVFNWVDISGVGTPIQFDPDGYCIDCTSGPFPIGFPFPFYGNSFTEVRITTEGFISFTSSRTTFSNQPLPNTGTTVPENLLAVFWDDLVLRNGTGSEPEASAAFYHHDGTRFIVQWKRFYRIADFDDDLNFQIILYPNGKIVYQYLRMDSQTLNSATIGQQNATKDDGLTVIHNLPYVHDGLAIEIQAGPEWLATSPAGGTIPAGGSQEVQVDFTALGLEDGLYEAQIDVASNDPYTPLVVVPVSLNVGLVEPAYLHFDPEVLNLTSNGRGAKMVIELPPGLDPHAVDPGSVKLNDTVPALLFPVEYTDENENGIEEVVLRFDRDALDAILPPDAVVDITVQGEVADVQWFRGTTTARTLRPRVSSPNGGEYLIEGQTVSMSWNPVQGGNVRYRVQLSRDGGLTWEALAGNLTATTYDWTAGGAPTSQARVRVIAEDNLGIMGYDTSDGDFIVAGPLLPPHDVGETLELLDEGGDVVLIWRPLEPDVTHGPADRYRILRSFSAEGPFTEIGQSMGESYRDPHAATQQAALVYYKVIASNAAGDASQQ
ncbi:MAG TPA: S8 family serine peptidase [Candidatus Polarisedimenticolia bacterium]|nr:S8 family serine peptidase [Candidatus Polarisedimenticolia bacterium]